MGSGEEKIEKVSWKRTYLTAAFIPLILALLVWMPVIDFGFLWDDWLMIQRQIPAMTVGNAFAPPVGLFGWTYNYYRPLTALSLLADASLHGMNPRGFHVTVWLLHTAACLAVFLLACRLMRRSAALLAASLFAVFPLHADSVAWVSGRTDPLAVLFGAGAAVLYLRSFASNRSVFDSHRNRETTVVRSKGEVSIRSLWLAASAGLLMFAALLSKETALALVPVLILAAWFHGNRGRQLIFASATVIIPLLLYLGLRFVLNPGPAQVQKAIFGSEPLEALQTVAWLARRLVFPYPEVPYLSKAPGHIVSFFVLIILFAVALLLFIQAERKKRFEWLVPLLWIGSGFALLAVSAFWLGAFFPVADRHLYFSAAGWTMLIAVLLVGSKGAYAEADKIRQEKSYTRLRYRTALGLAIGWILVAFFGWSSMERLPTYANNLSFWTSATTSDPLSGLAWINLGNARGEAKDYPGAEEAYRKSLNLVLKDSERARAMSGLGMTLVSSRKMEEGKDMLKQAAAHPGAGANEKFNYALFLFVFRGKDASSMEGRNNLERASSLLEQAVLEDPFFARAWLTLGQCEEKLGRVDRARFAFSRAASLDKGKQ